MTSIKWCAIYRRVSLKIQNPKLQVRTTSEYVLSHKIKDAEVEVFEDKCSGTTRSRPEFDRMVKGIEEGRIKKVVVFKLDRIGRSGVHLLQILELFRKHNVEFVSCKEAIDTSTSAGRLMYGMVALFAEFERECISERTLEWVAHRREKGLPLGRPKEAEDKKKRSVTGYVERWERYRAERKEKAISLHGEDASPAVLRKRIRELQKRLADKTAKDTFHCLPVPVQASMPVGAGEEVC